MTKRAKTNNGIQKVQGIHNPPQKRLFTLKEGAEYLGRSVWGMRELIWAGKIPVVKDPNGRKIFVDLEDLESYINRNKSMYS
ncbi:MAG: helix-turn-helix domain-containing protein [Syntrophaceae bacterium]|nr:helix-turn-helix domain-containing protein [Syntrophaceae bacterium]